MKQPIDAFPLFVGFYCSIVFLRPKSSIVKCTMLTSQHFLVRIFLYYCPAYIIGGGGESRRGGVAAPSGKMGSFFLSAKDIKNAPVFQEGGSTLAPPTPPVVRVVLLHSP